MRIDFHTHVFPDNLAPKALTTISKNTGSPFYTDGTIVGTDLALQSWHIDQSVALHIATNVKQQCRVNDWAAEIQTDKRFCYGSIHPDAPDALDELQRIKTLGLYGIKMHPYFQGFYIDDKRMCPIYDRMAQLGLPLLLHVGYDPSYPNATEGLPHRLLTVLDNFPNLTVIAAHMGGMGCYEEAEACLVGKPVYLDTGVASHYFPPDVFKRMIVHHDPQRILFGSDCPWSPSDKEADFIEQTDVSAEILDQIFYKNAQRVLDIK